MASMTKRTRFDQFDDAVQAMLDRRDWTLGRAALPSRPCCGLLASCATCPAKDSRHN